MKSARKAQVCACANHAFVPTTRSQVILTDPDDRHLIDEQFWSVAGGYAASFHNGKLHRLIMGATKGQMVDHINGDRLDNRRGNLRFCTASQNLQNKRKTGRGKPPLSPYKGVTFFAAQGRWAARISLNRRRTFLGYFDTDVDAARAYDLAAVERFGEFARVNFPGEIPCLQQL